MSEELSIRPYYSTAKDRVVKPSEVLPLSRYFIREWQRYLDRDEFKLIVTLRSLALDRGARSDESPEAMVSVSLPELEELTGISVANLKRKLSEKNLGNSHLGRFVRKQPQYRILEELGMARKTANAYFIQMDDPPAPHDEHRVLEEMGQIEALLHELQRSGGLTPELIAQLQQHAAAHRAHPDPHHTAQTDPSLGAHPDPVHTDQPEPGERLIPNRKGSLRAGQPDPYRGGPSRHESSKTSIEATKNVNVVSPASINRPGGTPEPPRPTGDPTARVMSRNRTRAFAQIDAIATECAARLSDLPNLGFYRRKATQLHSAGHLQRMLVVLERAETAIREKAATDPIENPGAYFNRLLQVEMTRLGVELDHVPGEQSPRAIRKIVERELRGDE